MPAQPLPNLPQQTDLQTPQALWAWPCQCEVCRTWGTARLCPACIARFASPVQRCPGCALRLGAAALRCGNCLLHKPSFSQTVCAVDYAFPWDQLILRFKFQAQAELAVPLAQRLLQAVLKQPEVPTKPSLLLPMPLSPQRLAWRGYNQAWELTKPIAKALKIKALADVLQRPLDNAHQANLNREQRLHNLQHAFYVPAAQRHHLQGQHVALIDDVMTTGASAHEASAELLRAGAVRVDLWVLARTAAPV